MLVGGGTGTALTAPAVLETLGSSAPPSPSTHPGFPVVGPGSWPTAS